MARSHNRKSSLRIPSARFLQSSVRNSSREWRKEETNTSTHMKHNLKHLPPFFSRLPLVIACLFALALVPGPHAQASSLSLDQNFNTPFFASEVLGWRDVLLPDGQ